MSKENIIVIAVALLLIGFLVYWFYLKPRTAEDTELSPKDVNIVAVSTANTGRSNTTNPANPVVGADTDFAKPFSEPCSSRLKYSDFLNQVKALATTIAAGYQKVLDCRTDINKPGCKLGIEAKILPYENPAHSAFGLSMAKAARYEAIDQLLWRSNKCVTDKTVAQIFNAENLPIPTI